MCLFVLVSHVSFCARSFQHISLASQSYNKDLSTYLSYSMHLFQPESLCIQKFGVPLQPTATFFYVYLYIYIYVYIYNIERYTCISCYPQANGPLRSRDCFYQCVSSTFEGCVERTPHLGRGGRWRGGSWGSNFRFDSQGGIGA